MHQEEKFEKSDSIGCSEEKNVKSQKIKGLDYQL